MFCFKQDDDCHWYLIPTEMVRLFDTLLEEDQINYYENFEMHFSQYRVEGSIELYRFDNPDRMC